MSGRSGCSAPFMPVGGDAQRGWRAVRWVAVCTERGERLIWWAYFLLTCVVDSQPYVHDVYSYLFGLEIDPAWPKGKRPGSLLFRRNI